MAGPSLLFLHLSMIPVPIIFTFWGQEPFLPPSYCFTRQNAQGKSDPRELDCYPLFWVFIIHKYQLKIVSPGRKFSTICAFFLSKQIAWLRLSLSSCILPLYSVNCQDTIRKLLLIFYVVRKIAR